MRVLQCAKGFNRRRARLTSTLATAITILAPSLAMPPASYLRPTMKPVMFYGRGGGGGRGAKKSRR